MSEERRYRPDSEIEKLNQALHDERARGRELSAENERLLERANEAEEMVDDLQLILTGGEGEAPDLKAVAKRLAARGEQGDQ